MLSPVSAAAVESPSIYGPYDNFEELYEAYMQAVEDGDTNQQAYLLEIGRTSLRAEIEMSQANTPAPAYDAVEQYCVKRFFLSILATAILRPVIMEFAFL